LPEFLSARWVLGGLFMCHKGDAARDRVMAGLLVVENARQPAALNADAQALLTALPMPAPW